MMNADEIAKTIVSLKKAIYNCPFCTVTADLLYFKLNIYHVGTCLSYLVVLLNGGIMEYISLGKPH
jgi:hypothetical protein